MRQVAVIQTTSPFDSEAWVYSFEQFKQLSIIPRRIEMMPSLQEPEQMYVHVELEYQDDDAQQRQAIHQFRKALIH